MPTQSKRLNKETPGTLPVSGAESKTDQSAANLIVNKPLETPQGYLFQGLTGELLYSTDYPTMFVKPLAAIKEGRLELSSSREYLQYS